MTSLSPPPYPIEQNESDRLIALRSFDVLDTAPEPSLDRIVGMAARLFDVPIHFADRFRSPVVQGEIRSQRLRDGSIRVALRALYG